MKDSAVAISIFVAVGASALAELEPRGVVIYQAPSTSYTEVMEYVTFRQDNALFSTLGTNGEGNKKLKSGGVIAVVAYPPLVFDSSFSTTADATLSKLEMLQSNYPSIQPQLQKVHDRWSRALSVYRQEQAAVLAKMKIASAKIDSLRVKEGVFEKVKLSSATEDSVTVTHSLGVLKLPLAELTGAQIASLNRSSDSVQLPLGLSHLPKSASLEKESPLTLEIEKIGGEILQSLSTHLEVRPTTFKVWALFVVFPAAVVVLLVALIFAARRPKQKILRS